VSQLPVKLTLHASGRLPAARTAFPAARTVICAQELTSMDLALRSLISWSSHACDLDAAMLMQIRSFRRLERLQVNCRERDGLHVLESGFASLTNLKALDLTMADNTFTFQQCARCLRHLGRLTHLALGLSNQTMHDAQPITELTKLQSLELHPDMIAKSDGSLLFPRVPELTRLCVRTMHSRECTTFPDGLIGVIRAYAPSLRTLKIRPPFADELSTYEMSLLSTFTRLEKLTLRGACVRRDEFFLTLRRMKSLTRLNLMPLDFTMPFVLMSILCLRQLKSLKIEDMTRRGWTIEAPPFHQLCHLTCLQVNGLKIGSLACLTALVDLRIYDRGEAYDISDTLRSTQHLTHLRLNGFRLIVPSESLTHLKALRSLSLEGVDVDESIFPALATLNLDDLHLCFCVRDDTVRLYPQVSLLTTLKRLTLASGSDSGDAPYEYLSRGTLKHLMYLNVQKEKLNLEEAEALRSKLPCLRKITTRFL